ncbi:hypothetical protein QE152_g38731 [Popillia japonica]|uniref:Uncharacterized protein n=1 Tax=Popillia japonica TaxID=7064 RepID=A0AAW1HW13_POPJA
MAKRKYLTAEELRRALEDSDDENYIFSDNDDEDGDFAVDNASDSEDDCTEVASEVDDDQVCSDNEDEEGSNNSNYNTPIIEYVSKDETKWNSEPGKAGKNFTS